MSLRRRAPLGPGSAQGQRPAGRARQGSVLLAVQLVLRPGGGRTAFAESRFWQAARATFMPPVDQDCLPASLLERFAGGGVERLLALLRFLRPITGGAGGHDWERCSPIRR